MKQRFSSTDIAVLTSELSALLPSLRLSNIYDLSSRIFLLKFAKPGSKHSLLVDSGFRCHLTSFARTTASEPSAFVRRLRKYLKSRRCTGVSQVGTDRVIEISFSEGQYRLYLEFFAAGNIILTDAELNVLALLRQVSEGDEDVDVKLGSKYVLEAKQNYSGVPEVSEERAKSALQKALERSKAAKEVGGKKAKRAKGNEDLRKALSAGFPEYPAHLLECAFYEIGVNVAWGVAEVLEDGEEMQKVMLALEEAQRMFKGLGTGPYKGYIVAKVKDSEQTTEGTQPPREALLYDDFHPFRPKQYESKKDTYILEIDGFNAAVDDFYSSLESQKLSSRLTEREETAKRKLQTAKDEHDKRLGALQHVQEIHIRKAQAIEANTHRVEEACAAVNGLIAQGLDWVNISKLIENEQSRGNVVAQLIKLPLKLQENTITLFLEEAVYEDSESEEDVTDSEASDSETETPAKPANKSDDKRLAIDIDLALSPWSNSRQYYDQRKAAAVKEQKTIQASGKALKSTEKKIADDLKKGLKQEKEVLREVRQQFWYEKFLWFISSEGYLVLSGKDAPQSEILYRRYCRKGDIYVHADLAGASPVIVKNNPKTPDAPIPPGTLSQAGIFCVCGSSAWDSKAVMSAWWVPVEQTSRVHSQTGELVSGGGVEVKGKKNWLPPTQLLLGFAVGWLISEGSRANHGKLRVGDVESGVQEMSLDDEKAGDDDDDNAEETGIPEDDITEEPEVPDVEDAADAAEEDIQIDEAEDAQRITNAADVASEAEDDDEGTQDGNDNEDNDSKRRNPLQSFTNQRKTDSDLDDDEDSDEEEHERVTNENSTIETPSQQTSTPRSDTPSSTAPSGVSITKTKPPPRGKRTKAARRAAAKYADQDEEDRALALELLGANKAEATATAKQAAIEDKEAKAQADRERRKRNQEKAAEREKARALAAATSGAAADEEEDAETLAQHRKEHEQLDRIVPQLQPGDEVLAAVPLCAPWSALNRYKYKVKLQPGGMKKGKAVREILGGWQNLGAGEKSKVRIDENNSDKERVWRVEVEKLKAVRDVEVLGQVPVKGVRIVQGGGLAGGSGSGGGGGGGKGKQGGNARGGKGGKRR